MRVFQISARENGFSFVISLWLLALLAAAVSAFALRAVQTIERNKASRAQFQLRNMLRSGRELLEGQIRARAQSSSARKRSAGLEITEIMSYAPKQKTRGLLITKIVRGRRNKWLEIFNDSDHTLVLSTLKDNNNPLSPITRLDEEVNPGEYLYLSSPGYPEGVPRDKVLRPRKLVLPKRGELKIWFREKDDRREWGTSSVVWGDTVGRDQLSFTSLPPLTGKAFVRERNDAGCPRANEAHSANLSLSNKIPDTGAYSTCPARRPPDRNEFIELYNTDTKIISPVEADYRIRDSVGAEGRKGAGEYQIVTHPRSNTMDSAVLMPHEVGLVIPPDFKFDDRRLRRKVASGLVKLFTLQPVGKERFQFLTEGLANQRTEHIELIGPDGKSDKVLKSWNSNWDSPAVIPHRSRQKIRPGVENISQNWERSARGGSPGEIQNKGGRLSTSKFKETSQWLPNQPVDKKLYWPSCQSSRQAGDVGYIQLVNLKKTEQSCRQGKNCEVYTVTIEAAIFSDENRKRLKKRISFQVAVNLASRANWGQILQERFK